MCIYSWAIIIWTIMMFVLSGRLYGEKCNPCNLMNIVWCVCSTLSTQGAFGFFVPGKETFKIIFIFLIVFSLSSLMFHIVFNYKNRALQYNGFSGEPLRFKGLYRMFLFGCILILPIFIKAIPLLTRNGIKELHNSFLLGASGYMGFWGFYVYAYIVRPFISALSVIAAYAFGMGSKESKRLIIVSLIGGIIHYIVSGGRKEVFNIVIFIAIVMLMKGTKKLSIWIRGKIIYIYKKAPSWRVLLFVLIGLGVLSVMTKYRLHFGLGVLGTFWMYFIGPMDYLDIIVNSPNNFGLTCDALLYGKATWGFITGPIEIVLRILVHRDYLGADYLMGIYTEKYYMISPKARINATTTIIYPFLKDYGDIGIVFGTLQFAFVVSVIYFFAKKGKKTGMWMCLLIYMYFTILFSVWRYTLVYYDGYMTIIWIVLIFGMKLIKTEKKVEIYNGT